MKSDNLNSTGDIQLVNIAIHIITIIYISKI